MYDEVKCKYPLPGITVPEAINFQTKDLDCALARYKISRKGKLFLLNSLRGDFGKTLFKHSGTIQIYTSHHGEWIQFEIVFVNGRLMHLKRQRFEELR